jgi:polar amino acid transport system substrate-binding protein
MSVRPAECRRAARPSFASLAVGALVAGALLSGCAAQSSGGSGPSASVSAGTDPKTLVPANIKSTGKLVVAADASYAPNEFFDSSGKTVIGMDADLAKAIADKLGLTVEIHDAKFDSIIPSLASGKYNLGMSSFTDNKTREATVDFVTYFSAGSSLMVKSGNPQNLSTTDLSLCGKQIAVEKGTTQEQTDLPADIAKCKSAGKPTITALAFDDQNGANLSLSSGRADAVLGDSPVIAYAAKQSSGAFAVSGDSYGNAPYGIAIAKDAGTLKNAVLAALMALMADGTYRQIITKWGVEAGAVSSPSINAATS